MASDRFLVAALSFGHLWPGYFPPSGSLLGPSTFIRPRLRPAFRRPRADDDLEHPARIRRVPKKGLSVEDHRLVPEGEGKGAPPEGIVAGNPVRNVRFKHP